MPWEEFSLLPVAYASEAVNEGYLKYTGPEQTTFSTFSLFSYFFLLVAVLLIVSFFAYYATKFIGGNIKKNITKKEAEVIGYINLGNNKNITFVNLQAKILVLGVTDANINLLKEIVNPEEVEEIKNKFSDDSDTTEFFRDNIQVLTDLKSKFNPLVKNIKNLKGKDKS